ncbi:sulfotransferase domain-containing protein [Alloyangia pacifica]|uniref:sulfotransferase domain-containing protein n=1 Tax=Alloyangia pacifica TaxID=311180 RepID=UPI001CFEA6D4|nr:sulfotransferase domain-containing protein [Alloyangia pacifica]
MKNPNTFIIGAPKCGTTALAAYLNDHPNVFFSNPKEVFYWCFDFPKLKHELKIENIEDYLKLFAAADPEKHKVVAEGSTRYLRSKNAVKNILEFDPKAKIIVMARNPIELAPAYHMEQRYSLHEDVVSFEEAWKLQSKRARGEAIPRGCREPEFLQYGKVASLGEQISHLQSIVPEDQLMVILIDDLKKDAESVYRKTLQFLELPDDGRSEFPVMNSAHGHRVEWLAKLILTPPSALEKPVLALRKHLWEKRYPPVEYLKRSLNQKKSRQEMPQYLLAELQEYFRDDILLLSKSISRDLTHWLPR